MAEKQTKTGPVQREIKPNKNRPFEINVSGRSFRGSVIVESSKESKEEKPEIVESKTRFIPPVFVAVLMAGKGFDKIEKMLIPLVK